MLQVTRFRVELLGLRVEVVVLFVSEFVKEEGGGFGVVLAENEFLVIWVVWALGIDNGGRRGECGSGVAKGVKRERAGKGKVVLLT